MGKTKIKVSCSKAAYERILECAEGYYERGICILGKNYFTCPAMKKKDYTCAECLRKNIVRVEEV
jgi:hypothetical protein